MAVRVVWFKRDLRLVDHAPLTAMAERGVVLALWVYEPAVLGSAEFDRRHLDFVNESLRELDAALRERGGRLTVRVGDMPAVLGRLAGELAPAGGLAELASHEETGTAVTFDRDRAVADWCRRNGVRWTETPQHGVVRRLRSRDGWAGRWARRMTAPAVSPPDRVVPVDTTLPEFDHGRILDADELAERGIAVAGEPRPEQQSGGRAAGVRTLESFLADRGVNYRADMASPVAGWDGCSRLSPHLAWGTISIREAHRAAAERTGALRALRPSERDARWLPSLRSFQGRLRWHCHFMQKLETEPAIEFHNMNRAYDGLRTEDPADWTDEERRRFAAWEDGRTGYPMVDACMRCVTATGWLNFRMRAMLVSFLAYHLWLHWRPGAIVLARRFLDFEAGIHYSQFQMQSGVTGINSIRIYSPVRQAEDQDPTGVFIRRWCPELEGVPDEHLARPERMPPLTQRMAGCVIGEDSPEPVVEHEAAMKAARTRIFERKGTAAARAAAREVYVRHGSRKGRRPSRAELDTRLAGEDMPEFRGGRGRRTAGGGTRSRSGP